MRQLQSGFVMLCLTVLLLACTQANSTPFSTTTAVSTNSAVRLSPVVNPDRTATFTPQSSTSTSSTKHTILRSPEVNADRTITLRLRAAYATSVTASGDFGDLILTKDAQNIWSVTTAPLEPAIYRYAFIVDGVQMADPDNPGIKGISESLVTVPGDPPMPWELRNVPHGHVTQVLYYSPVFNTQRRYFVYTPPSYETTIAKLPALYLLHGYTDDDSSWTAVGKANLIADNLLADGKIKPLLIIMPYGQLNSRVTLDEALATDFQQQYERQLLTEIIPYVEQTFRAVPDAKHRGIAGLSMGGLQAAIVGMNHPETFSTVGMWSSAFFGDPSLLLGRLVAAPDGLKHSFLYVHVGVGQQDPLLPRSDVIDQFLTSQNIAHEFTPTLGTHSWLVWRSYLVDFLPKFSAAAQ
jgi:enterochelin esterase-like enzyme